MIPQTAQFFTAIHSDQHTNMKRFTGLLLAGVGGIGAIWGGYYALTGQTNTYVTITDDLSISALTTGLIGVAVFTIGLLWTRD
jgi:hypothetical protein